MDTNQRADWSEDKLALCQPQNFGVLIGFANTEGARALMRTLTPADRQRLDWKLELVQRLAAKLAANMAKGCLKYRADRDDMAPEDWIEYLVDDAADTLNYAFLLKRALHNQ